MTLEQHFVEEVKSIRARLAQHNVPYFRLEVEASGRVDGETKITFELKLGESYYGDDAVAKGHDLLEVVKEALRRSQWNDRNAPLMLAQASEE